MHHTIQTRLQEIAQQQEVKIIHAIESGSRAWGFPSTDSDYDVRFIYAHRPEWYLSIDMENRRDVIEYPVDNDDLDITGWDLRKALMLLYKSNPPLLEWFSSPIVYATNPVTFGPMQTLAPAYFSPSSCMHHYRRIAEQQYTGYAKGGKRKLKQYFYALRCALAYHWIDQGRGIVPMPFADLVAGVVASPERQQQIWDLVEVKRTSRESDSSPHMAEMERYLEAMMDEMETTHLTVTHSGGTVDALNAYFRASLGTLW